MVDVKPVITEESNDKSKIWKLTEVSEPSQCRSLRLPENLRVAKVYKSTFLSHVHSFFFLTIKPMTFFRYQD